MVTVFKTRSLVAAVLATALAAGCTVDNAKEMATWRGKLDSPLPPAAALAPGQVLTLQQALAMANASNERLALSGENYLQALIDKDRAVAALLPSITLAPSYTQMQKFAAPSQVLQLFPLRYADVPVQIALQFSASDVAKVAKAEVLAEYQLSLLLNLQADILVETAQVYYQVLQLERQIGVLENSVKVQNERVRDMRDKQKAGLARPLDVSLLEADAAGTRASLVDARNRLTTARSGLAFLVGVPALPNPLSDAFAPPTVPPLAEMQQQASTHRQDLLAARTLVAAADRGLNAAVTEYFPSLSLDLTTWLERQSFPPDSRWFITASLYMPIFSGGRIHADVRTASSLVRQAGQYLSLTSRQVTEQVEVAYANLEASGRRVEEYRTETAAAREALALAEQSYDVGLATNLERLIAQDRLLEAELQLAVEELNRKILYFQLSRQAGLLVDEFSSHADRPLARGLNAESAETAENKSRTVIEEATKTRD
jgi:outer membrane protein TolC